MALKSSLAWMGAGQVVALVLQFASSVVLARLLTPYEMGIYAVAAATAGLLAIIQALGLQSLIVREDTLAPEVVTTAFTINVLIALSLAGGCALLALFGGMLFQDKAVRQTLLVLAVQPLFGIFEFLPSAQLERRGQFKIMSMVTSAGGLAGTACTITLAVLGFKYLSAAYAGWATAVTTAVLMNVVGREHVAFRVGFKSWRRVANFGLQMLAVSGVNAVNIRLSDVLLGRIQGLGSLGLYSRAGSLKNLVWNNVNMVVARVMLVDFVEVRRSGAPLRARYIQTVDVATAALWPAFAGLALLSGPFVLHVYGARWLPACRPLIWLAIGSMIQVSFAMTWEIFAAKGELSTQTRIEIIRTLFSLAAFVAGCFFSLEAAAASRVPEAVFAFLLYRPHLDRMTDTRVRDFAPVYGRSLWLTALAIGPAAILMASTGFSPYTPIAEVLASILLGGLLWLVGLAMCRHTLMRELYMTLKRLRPIAALSSV